MSRNSKTAKMVLGRYYRVLNSKLALTLAASVGPTGWSVAVRKKKGKK